ncbi:MAG: hypothetical protein MUC80_08725 [Candidatus Thermoplasmatota archaeon]|nr:hypothetical protein [Candidatus Thermoplasmatota archaeon]
MDYVSLVNIGIVGITTVFSLGLLMISLISYHKSKNKKIFFVSLLLLLFSLKNLLLSFFLFTEQIPNNFTILALEFFDLLILVFLFIAVLTK